MAFNSFTAVSNTTLSSTSAASHKTSISTSATTVKPTIATTEAPESVATFGVVIRIARFSKDDFDCTDPDLQDLTSDTYERLRVRSQYIFYIIRTCNE